MENKLFDETDIALDLCESDFNELKYRCYRKFGWPTVNIEIDDPTFNYIIKDTLNLLSTWVPKVVDIPLHVKSYQSDYVISEYNKIGAILDIGVSTDFLIGIGLPIQAMLAMPMSLGASNNVTMINDFMSLMAAHNMAKNVWQAMPMPELIHPNIIRISPLPYMDDKWLARITVNHENNLGSLNKWEKNWLIRYCTCQVGKFIGNVRRKYEGAALPVGSLSTSGSSIFSESVEEEKTLMEELHNYKKFGQMYISIG